MTVKERIHRLVDELPDELPPDAVARVVAAISGVEDARDGEGDARAADARSGGQREQRIGPRAATPEQRVRAWQALMADLPKTGYLLTDEDISRKRLYEGHG